MPTEGEIRGNHKALHDAMSAVYYAKSQEQQAIDKADFDAEHGTNWDELEAELITEGYREAPVPERDLPAEVDALRTRLDNAAIN